MEKEKKNQVTNLVGDVNNLVEGIEERLTNEMISELELDEKETEIFLQLKSVLIDKCELLDFEALNIDRADDYAEIITYIKNKRLFIEDDGITVKLRKPLLTDSKEVLTDHVKILYERNISREEQFTKNEKIKKGDIASQKSYARAALAASLANIDIDGRSKIISPKNISEKNVHHKDFALMMSCYNFFRS